MAGVVKDDRVPGLRHIDEVLLHGGENAVARGLIWGKTHHAGANLAWSRVGEQSYVVRGKAEFGAGEHIGNRLRIIHGALEVFEAAQLASPIDAAGFVHGGGARWLV
jgi:hypothetical protein